MTTSERLVLRTTLDVVITALVKNEKKQDKIQSLSQNRSDPLGFSKSLTSFGNDIHYCRCRSSQIQRSLVDVGDDFVAASGDEFGNGRN